LQLRENGETRALQPEESAVTDTAGAALPDTVIDWMMRRGCRAEQWSAEELLGCKGGQRVSVVIPARDEAATIGSIVSTVRRCLIEELPLVDELIVVDSGSADATAAVAFEAGAHVVAQGSVLPQLPAATGKGEALWKGLAASTGDLVVFVDGDLRDFSPHFVVGLVGPLLTDPGIAYVKGFYHRPLVSGESVEPDGGGRVTELVARPLLNLYWPELAGFVQPLAGECAGRRCVLERIPFVTHYGVEVGHLIDLLALCGLDSLAQVDLGTRTHRHQSNHGLGIMAGQILLTALNRLERAGRIVGGAPASTTIAQFRRGVPAGALGRELVLTDVSVVERPPLVTLGMPSP
jgi:glucosyl-3-phosphoglycerate synthase